MTNVTKILVPTDFSEHSARALSRGVDIAKQNGAEIVLLHVVDQDIHACTMDYCMQEEEVERQREAMIEGRRPDPPHSTHDKEVVRSPAKSSRCKR